MKTQQKNGKTRKNHCAFREKQHDSRPMGLREQSAYNRLLCKEIRIIGDSGNLDLFQDK